MCLSTARSSQLKLVLWRFLKSPKASASVGEKSGPRRHLQGTFATRASRLRWPKRFMLQGFG
jgi:hypothetical protein